MSRCSHLFFMRILRIASLVLNVTMEAEALCEGSLLLEISSEVRVLSVQFDSCLERRSISDNAKS